MPIINTGLRGVEVASTRICNVLGSEGKLIYRGFLIEDLAQKASFEEVCFLLMYERLPTHEELDRFSRSLVQKRQIPENIYGFLKGLESNAHPMDVLQAAVPMLAQSDTLLGERSMENALLRSENLVSGIAVITAAFHRLRNNKPLVPPREDLGHAANFLYMLTGEVPDERTAHYFDVALVLHAEHSFNASTFTARQVASTRAHMYAAISAAIGSLSGELHGGANVRVMEMLKKIGNKEHIDGYIDDTLKAGGLIMGLGHAVYQTDDPRAKILAPMSRELGERTGQPQWYELSKTLEVRAKKAFKEHKQRDIFVNVDFYSASLFYAMGIPIDLFSPIFAVSRVIGWAAHIIEEQYATAAPKPSLYRPGAAYVGDYCGPDECTFTDLEER
ncbi:MAG: citrate (Si)-synthase [Desulfobacteraceae bacterium]|nr:MAG: citrate (Si)-synthase [Desulfobacteraceae bacterium]